MKSKNKSFTNIKNQFQLKNVDSNKITVSNKISFGKKGFKYFIGFKDAKKIRPLCIFLPKMTAYRKDIDKTKYMTFW